MSSSTWQQEWPEQAVLSQPPVPSAKAQSSRNQRGVEGPYPPRRDPQLSAALGARGEISAT